jgi:hypothetical protein
MHDKPHQENQNDDYYSIIGDEDVHPFHYSQYPKSQRMYDPCRATEAGHKGYGLDEAQLAIPLIFVKKAFVLRPKIELEVVCLGIVRLIASGQRA